MNKLSILLVASLGLMTTSCNDFLDTMPDKRTELNNADKIQQLLVSAYPTVGMAGMLEHRTDNVEDNGPTYTINQELHESYTWGDIKEVDWDAPKAFWDNIYASVSAANQALEAIEELGNGPELQAARGEALLCRAWGHFMLVNVFGHAYNGQTSATDLGAPYYLVPEKKIGVVTPRLKVKEVYELIEKDLLEGLPLIDDSKYKQGAILFHFNSRAAAAFAAQFYLYYEQWDKAKKYATQAIGEDPSGALRRLESYSKQFNTAKEWTNGYNSTAEPANLMLQATRSLWGRRYMDMRYAHNARIAEGETLLSRGPWGNSHLPAVGSATRHWTNSPQALKFIWKMDETFVVTNVLAQTGQPYVIARPFTVDRTLLVRAEAEVMLGEYEAAARDLSYWYVANGGTASTAEQIARYYEVGEEGADMPEASRIARAKKLATIAKPLNPKFALSPGMQYNMIQAVLHARRIDGVFEGHRWDDIKRYGIEITHQIYEGELLKLGSSDQRRALQIPADIIQAGIVANPR